MAIILTYVSRIGNTMEFVYGSPQKSHIPGGVQKLLLLVLRSILLIRLCVVVVNLLGRGHNSGVVVGSCCCCHGDLGECRK